MAVAELVPLVAGAHCLLVAFTDEVLAGHGVEHREVARAGIVEAGEQTVDRVHTARWLNDTDGAVTVDLAKVTLADSAGVALMLEWLEQARIVKRELKYINLPEQVKHLIDVSEAAGIDWRTYRAHGIVGGEGMSEGLRDYLETRFQSVYSAYGASDLAIGTFRRAVSLIIPRMVQVALVIHRADGSTRETSVLLRIDTPIEVDYYKHGGILPFVLRQLLAA